MKNKNFKKFEKFSKSFQKYLENFLNKKKYPKNFKIFLSLFNNKNKVFLKEQLQKKSKLVFSKILRKSLK